jgi:hypothetical protein
MSRSGYIDDCDYDQWRHIMWRGQIASTIRGKRGQAFLKEMLAALDALPEKRLIKNHLVIDPVDVYGPPTADQYYRDNPYQTTKPEFAEVGVCAIGTVGLNRGIDMKALDPEDYNAVAATFGITHQLVREIEYVNDEQWDTLNTPESRWQRVRDWCVANIIPDV